MRRDPAMEAVEIALDIGSYHDLIAREGGGNVRHVAAGSWLTAFDSKRL
jgi:hypothetical protein